MVDLKIIAFVHLFKPHLGGLERYAEEFYKNLDEKVLIITSLYRKDLKTEETIGNMVIKRIASFVIIQDKYYIPSPKGLVQIIQIVRAHSKCHPEIHTHTRFYLQNFIATILAKKYNLQIFHFEHGASFVRDGSIFVQACALFFDITIARYILSNSQAIFPVSNNVRNFLEQHYKHVNFGPTIYNSYDFTLTTFLKRKKPKTIRLLFVGRLVKSKGIYELIATAKLLKDNNIPFKLTLVGDGSEREEISDLVTVQELGEQVQILGALPFEQTLKEYHNHDIFINPSYTEGFGLTVLEALANNLIVIATNTGVAKELIPDKYLIGTNNITPEEISYKIMSVVDNWDSYEDAFVDLFSSAKKKFSWKRNIQKFREWRIKR